MKKLVFILPIAQGDIQRAVNTINSINLFCADHVILCSLDGRFSAPEVEKLDNTRVFHSPITSKGNWGAIWHNQFHALLEYKASGECAENCIFVKIDSDAIVVREGLFERASKIMATRNRIGLMGQINNDVNGQALSNNGWKNYYSKMVGWRGYRDFVLHAKSVDGNTLSFKEKVKRYRYFKSLVKRAPSPEKYAIGGCYIVSSAFLSALHDSKLLEQNPFLSQPNYGEDAITGLVVQALGFNVIDDVLDEGIFAVGGIYNKYEEVFRCDPREIKKRNHIVIHPVKFGYKDSNTELSENELVKELLNDTAERI